MTRSINFAEFEDIFSELYSRAAKEYKSFSRNLNQIENFKPSPGSDRFSWAIHGIFRIFDAVEDEFTSEQEATSYVKETCLRNRIFKDEIDIWT